MKDLKRAIVVFSNKQCEEAVCPNVLKVKKEEIHERAMSIGLNRLLLPFLL